MVQAANSKHRIIETAIDLFSTKGFKGTSIRDIARSLNMSNSNLYHYFGNKEGLWLAILEHSSEAILEDLRWASEMETDPLERFKHLLKTHIGRTKDHIKEAKIFFIDEEHLTPEGNQINRRIQREILGIYLRALRDLRKAGYVKGRSITVLAFNILGVINWHLKWYRPEGSMSLEDISEEVISFILHGTLGKNI
jgi:AcrR family transcriptional regulator